MAVTVAKIAIALPFVDDNLRVDDNFLQNTFAFLRVQLRERT